MYTIGAEWFSARKEATEEQIAKRIKQAIEVAEAELNPESHFTVEVRVTKSTAVPERN
jgi:hypothetical protein